MFNARVTARFFACILLLACAGKALAGAEPSCSRPLRLAYSMLPPLYFLDESNGVGRGVEVDIADELSRRTGCSMQPKYESRIRIWAAFESGQIDISMSGVATESRERFAVFLPYLRFKNVLLVNDEAARANKVGANPMSDPAASLSVTRGFHYGPPWEQWISKLRERDQVFDVAEEGDAVRLVALGRTSTTIVREIALPFYAGLYHNGQALRPVDVGAAAGTLSVVLSRKTLEPATLDALTKALADIKADGTLQRILKRHLPTELVDRTSIN
jgi:polar amino acid transport system substrate-binding protein